MQATRRAAVSCRRAASRVAFITRRCAFGLLPSPPPRVPKVGIAPLSVGRRHERRPLEKQLPTAATMIVCAPAELRRASRQACWSPLAFSREPPNIAQESSALQPLCRQASATGSLEALLRRARPQVLVGVAMRPEPTRRPKAFSARPCPRLPSPHRQPLRCVAERRVAVALCTTAIGSDWAGGVAEPNVRHGSPTPSRHVPNAVFPCHPHLIVAVSWHYSVCTLA